MYPPRAGGKRPAFTRRKSDGRHTVKIFMEIFLQWVSMKREKIHEHATISDKWDDYNEDAYEEANRARWK